MGGGGGGGGGAGLAGLGGGGGFPPPLFLMLLCVANSGIVAFHNVIRFFLALQIQFVVVPHPDTSLLLQFCAIAADSIQHRSLFPIVLEKIENGAHCNSYVGNQGNLIG